MVGGLILTWWDEVTSLRKWHLSLKIKEVKTGSHVKGGGGALQQTVEFVGGPGQGRVWHAWG